MPIYVYRCASCGHEVEKLQPSFTSPPPDCEAGRPSCFGSPMERVPAASNFGGFSEGKKGSAVSEAIKRVKALPPEPGGRTGT